MFTNVFFFCSNLPISPNSSCAAISHFPSPWSVLLVSTLSHLFPPGHRFGRKHILFVLICSFFPLIRIKYSPVPSFPSMSTRMVSARSHHFPSMLWKEKNRLSLSHLVNTMSLLYLFIWCFEKFPKALALMSKLCRSGWNESCLLLWVAASLKLELHLSLNRRLKFAHPLWQQGAYYCFPV